ncbi:MAG: Hsp33 family molecular chaperone HslO [Schwartzia sp.]|nr:Hsp33 family molecular chaperone HslO [Schwartzia sp. (in: firmicutes)]
MDKLVKATADGVRAYAAVTTGLTGEAMRRHGCGALAGAALGRTMTGALLFAANLKEKECITIKFKGDGPLGAIVADASAEGAVRGYVAHPEVELPLTNGKLSVGQGVGRGLLSVTRFTGMKDNFTGSCEIFSGEIAEDLTRYLYQSEQTPSSVGLGVLIGTDGMARAAGGFIIQPLPDASDEVITRLEENLKHIAPVSEMVDNGKTPKEIIAALLRGFDEIKYLSETDLSFKCQCSKHRTEEILMTLSHDDISQLVEDGKAEVVCQFCGEKYHFSKEELIALMNVADQMRQ